MNSTLQKLSALVAIKFLMPSIFLLCPWMQECGKTLPGCFLLQISSLVVYKSNYSCLVSRLLWFRGSSSVPEQGHRVRADYPAPGKERGWKQGED